MIIIHVSPTLVFRFRAEAVHAKDTILSTLTHRGILLGEVKILGPLVVKQKNIKNKYKV